MKAIFICYNYLTLYKALYTIKHNYKDNETIIIFRETVSPIPKNLKTYTKVYNINKSKMFSNKIIDKLRIIKKTVEIIKKETVNIDNIDFIVFKDNELIESTLIEKVKKLDIKSKKILLIEEGLGIYEKEAKQEKRNLKILLKNKVLNFFDYHIYDKPQGYNPLVDEIICSDDKLLKKIKGELNLNIFKHSNMFSQEEVMFFVVNILGYELSIFEKYKNYEVVFLSQPLKEIGITDRENKRIFSVLSLKPCLIKRHPRESDELYVSSNKNIVELDNKLNEIPFECLYTMFNSPIVITYFSSSYKNILMNHSNAKVISLYKLLNNQRVNNNMKNNVIEKEERFFAPSNIKELEKIMKSI